MKMNDQFQPVKVPLELAFIRWSVVCHQWWEYSSGSAPILQAFLAGWFCRCIGTTLPVDVGQWRDSFRVGWREADQQIAINLQSLLDLSTVTQTTQKE